MVKRRQRSSAAGRPHGRLQPTAAYYTFWRFAAERQEVFFRRIEGREPPWSNDPILRAFKFTNAYRASDRVSQYLIRRVIYRDDLPNSPNEVVFRILLFKLFNKIETWELFENKLGSVTFDEFSVREYDQILERALANGRAIYSAAYIMPSGGRSGFARKHRNHLACLAQMMADQLPTRLADACSMADAFELVRSYPMIGDFLAYQYVTDINYSSVTDFSEMEFVAPGPGALDGIQKCFGDTGGLSGADVIRFMADRQEAEFDRLGLRFRNLWGRSLQLIDCQNLFCEVGKYARVAHPEIAGVSNRAKIKQRFRPSSDRIDYWYPPKWAINNAAAANAGRLPAEISLFSSAQETTMDLRTYQLRASGTDRNPGRDEHDRMIPLAGLASETGELLAEYKKYLRDGESHRLFKERLAEEVGDVLWYLANAATKFDLDLSEVARQNLSKSEDRWGSLPERVAFDATFPPRERLPRKLAFEFQTVRNNGSRSVRVFCGGKPFGDKLKDNSYVEDGYGFHDVIHLAFAAILGWSPLVRRMLRAKRRSDPKTDEVEDGGRAIAIEEGVSAMVFAYAREYNFLEGKSSVSSEVLRLIRNMVAHLEVSVCTAGEWEHAIVQGFQVWREVSRREGGHVHIDLDLRQISFGGV
jgi:NTP pyrophosphatase (non-canonical NTP hydrolase)